MTDMAYSDRLSGQPLPAASTHGTSEGLLIQGTAEGCRECWACVRYCPVDAIRAVGGHPEVVAEKCIRCGSCVSACGNGGRVVRDDLPGVLGLLESGRPVVALLATEFVAALHPLKPPEIERKLEAAGFYSVESTFLGEEMVAEAYERMHGRADLPLTLRSTCPVVVDLVRKYHPVLVPALAPIVPPYMAQARMIRQLYPDDVAVVYASPCYARKDEIRNPEFEGLIDVAVDFVELRTLLHSDRTPEVRLHMSECGAHRPMPLKEVSLTDGFPRQTLMSRNMTDSDIVKVRGIRQTETLLNAMEAGETAPLVVDMLSCEGCLDGPTVNPGMSVFAKRNVVTAEQESRASAVVGGRALLRYLPAVELRRTFKANPVRVPYPDEDQIDAALADGDMTRESAIDCGACGHDTCVEHAVAVLQGNGTWAVCLPLQRERLEEEGTRLRESASIDVLTGLWNRRAFNERLAEEVARTRRYGTPLSLLMIDLDGFKEVNDKYGHLAGDRLLAAMGTVLRESIRETDIPVRYGGDEFAVVLPGVGKTEAYAVAEKLRYAIDSVRVGAENNGDELRVSASASVGVASVGHSCTSALDLLEAADRALYQAKESGRNRVMIAPG